MAKEKSKKPSSRAKPRAAKPTAAKRTRSTKAKAAAKPAAKAKARAKPKAPPVRKAQIGKPSPPVVRAKPRPPQIGRDWSATLFLPKTDFPMKAGLPEREPELLKRWERLRLYDRMREEAMGREKFILHDGPPYANGHLHI